LLFGGKNQIWRALGGRPKPNRGGALLLSARRVQAGVTTPSTAPNRSSWPLFCVISNTTPSIAEKILPCQSQPGEYPASWSALPIRRQNPLACHPTLPLAVKRLPFLSLPLWISSNPPSRPQSPRAVRFRIRLATELILAIRSGPSIMRRNGYGSTRTLDAFIAGMEYKAKIRLSMMSRRMARHAVSLPSISLRTSPVCRWRRMRCGSRGH